MVPPAGAVQHQPDEREGLSPSPGAPSPGVVTIADLLEEEDDDDIEFEPSTERSENSDWIEEEEDEDGDEYVGMIRHSLVFFKPIAESK